MITAVLNSFSGLIPAFLVLAILICVPGALWARAKRKPVTLTVLCGVSLAGVVAATLFPRAGTDQLSTRTCQVAGSLRGVLSTQQGQMNVALFVPLCFFCAMLLRRPLLVLAAGIVLSAGIEVAQAVLPLGRACDTGDFMANVIGTAAGTVLGTGAVLAARKRLVVAPRTAIRDTGAPVLGIAALALVFHFAITPVHDAGGMVGATSAQNDLARSTAVRLFGPSVKVTAVQLMEATPDSSAQLWVTMDQGRIQLDWPSRQLVSAVSSVNYDDNGSLSTAKMRAAGARFAATWFPEDVKGSKSTFGSIPKTRAMILTYRRYRNGVMMPMRLDLTVSSAGRVISVESQSIPDPRLPRPLLGKAQAQRIATRQSGGKISGPTFLLAQKVYDTWRPCWAVNIQGAGGSQTAGAVFVDAVSGQVIERQDVTSPQS